MAVNVGERHVPDTAANRQLDACFKAMDLAIHTIKVTANEKIFKPEFQAALTSDIIRCAKDVYICTWNANNVYVSKENRKRWPERERLQYAAILKCNELLALINLARRLFHLRSNKVEYWSALVIEARKLIRAWHEADAARYGDAG